MGHVCGQILTQANTLGDVRLAANYARPALNDLPISNDLSCSLRSAATSIYSDASWMNGNLVEAKRACTDDIQISQAAGNIHMEIIANSILLERALLLAQPEGYCRVFLDEEEHLAWRVGRRRFPFGES